MKQKMTTSQLVTAALFAALSCIATMIIEVPSPMSGYVNLGDGVVLLCGFILGPGLGAAAAGIGSMLADLLSGYAHYAPGTLVIKAAVAFLGGLIYHGLTARDDRAGRRIFPAILSGVIGETVMVLGYFGYASLLLGRGLAAAASIPGNIVQGVFGVAISTALILALSGVPIVRRHVYAVKR